MLYVKCYSSREQYFGISLLMRNDNLACTSSIGGENCENDENVQISGRIWYQIVPKWAAASR